MPDVLLLQLDAKVAHVPSATHGVALCGEVMRDPWQCGPAQAIAQHAHQLCGACWERYRSAP